MHEITLASGGWMCDMMLINQEELQMQMQTKKIYGSNGIGRNLGRPTKNELHNIRARLADHHARTQAYVAKGVDPKEASAKAFEDIVGWRL